MGVLGYRLADKLSLGHHLGMAVGRLRGAATDIARCRPLRTCTLQCAIGSSRPTPAVPMQYRELQLTRTLAIPRASPRRSLPATFQSLPVQNAQGQSRSTFTCRAGQLKAKPWEERATPVLSNDVWAMDFVDDSLATGSKP